MWADWERDPDRHFYVGEVARTRGGKYVIPRRWVIFDGEEHAEVSKVQFSETVRLKQDSLRCTPSDYQCRQKHFR